MILYSTLFNHLLNQFFLFTLFITLSITLLKITLIIITEYFKYFEFPFYLNLLLLIFTIHIFLMLKNNDISRFIINN